MKPNFILIVDGNGLESLINLADISHIKEDEHQMSGQPIVTAKIDGIENRAILCAGPEAHKYFTWLKSIVNLHDYYKSKMHSNDPKIEFLGDESIDEA